MESVENSLVNNKNLTIDMNKTQQFGTRDAGGAIFISKNIVGTPKGNNNATLKIPKRPSP